jgi:phosphate transport system substrate-binding protein
VRRLQREQGERRRGQRQQQQPAAAERHPERRRVECPAGRHAGLDRWLQQDPARRHGQLRPRRLRRRPRAVPLRRRRLRPLSTDEELPKAKDRCGGGEVFELPNYISAIAVIYNLQGVDKLNLSPETTAKIFNGTIKTWNDPAIKADNPDANLPSTAITPVHRSDKSGTTKNFTDYLDKASNGTWTDGAVDEWPTQGGEAAEGTAGVVSAVKSGQGTSGYADESQAAGLGIANIKVGSDFVAPSPEGAAAVVESSTVQSGRGQYDFALDVNRVPDSSDQYPLVLVSYHIGCIQYDNKDTADLVKAFENYVISSDGQKAAADQAGSSPITDTLRQQSQKAVDAISSK